MPSSALPDSTLRDSLAPPAPRSGGSGWLLALLVHALLVGLLAWGVHWQSAPAGDEAWIDNAIQEEGAAASPPEPAPPPPAAKEIPAPLPVATPTQAAPKQAELVERQEAEKKRKQQEQEAQERQRRETEARQRAEQQAQRAREAREAEERAKAEQAHRAKADAAKQAREKAQLEATRKEQLARMARLAGTGGANSNAQGKQGAGRNARSSGRGLSDAYKRKIANAVRPNIQFSGDDGGHLSADVEVRASPTGEILSRRLMRSSGDRIYDQAVLRALDRTGRLPKDENGQVPAQFTAAFSWP